MKRGRGRPNGTRLYDIGMILRLVGSAPRTTNQIVKYAQKEMPGIQWKTVQKYLKDLQGAGQIEEVYNSKNGFGPYAWRRVA
jgi:hypothetical protein